MCIEWAAVIILVLWRKSNHFDEDTREHNFYIFVPNGLGIWPLDLKLDPLVTLIQRCVFTKLEISTPFLVR